MLALSGAACTDTIPGAERTLGPNRARTWKSRRIHWLRIVSTKRRSRTWSPSLRFLLPHALQMLEVHQRERAGCGMWWAARTRRMKWWSLQFLARKLLLLSALGWNCSFWRNLHDYCRLLFSGKHANGISLSHFPCNAVNVCPAWRWLLEPEAAMLQHLVSALPCSGCWRLVNQFPRSTHNTINTLVVLPTHVWYLGLSPVIN